MFVCNFYISNNRNCAKHIKTYAVLNWIDWIDWSVCKSESKKVFACIDNTVIGLNSLIIFNDTFSSILFDIRREEENVIKFKGVISALQIVSCFLNRYNSISVC